MTTFLNKLRIITLGSAHDLLDKAIDLNSPSALRQYTRDLEDALDKMRNEAAIQAGQLRTMERERGDLESKITTGKEVVAKVLATESPNKEDVARTKAREILRWQESLKATISNLAVQTTTSAQIDKAVAQLDAKHQDIVARVRELERLDRDSKAKEQAASSLQQASKLASSDISIDNVEEKMRARNDVASEKFDRAMGSIATEEDPDSKADVDNLLAEIAGAKPAK